MYQWVRSPVNDHRIGSAFALLALALSIVLPGGGCGDFNGQKAEIASIDPNHGPAAGGTAVTIAGSNLQLPLAVTFNDEPATGLNLIDSGTLELITPPGDPGLASVTLTLADGSVITLPDAFTYDEQQEGATAKPLTIAAITPVSGPTAGGTLLTVQGANFVPAATLLIGGQPAGNLTYVDEATFTATTPPGTAGVADVVLNTDDGRTTSYPSGFTYSPDDSACEQPDQVSITGIYPDSGPQCGGLWITIKGTYFDKSCLVYFDDICVETIYVDCYTLKAIAPPHDPGWCDISVMCEDCDRVVRRDCFEYLCREQLDVFSFDPCAGPLCGGTLVTLRGNGFTPGAIVLFGDRVSLCVEVISDEILTAVSPPRDRCGAVELTVLLPDDQCVTTDETFEYLPKIPYISCIKPPCGPECGGTAVLIDGYGFIDTCAVYFDGCPAIFFAALSDTQILAISPPGYGTVPLLVSSLTGSAAALFTYVPPGAPVITSLSPASGPEVGGTIVIINGYGFTFTTEVNFGEVFADFEVLSDTQILAASPGGTGIVPVIVVTPGGSAAASFTYSALTIDSLSPSSGPEVGGTTVLIKGTGFFAANSVVFGGALTEFVILSDTQIEVLLPPGTGTVAVLVNTFFDTAAALFTYVPPGVTTISNVCPDAGPAAGGTEVLITGTGFTGLTILAFGNEPAPIFTVLSDTQIIAITPPGVGSAPVVAISPTGTAAAPFTYFPPGTFITKVSPPCGSQEGGTLVFIEGVGFAGTTSVYFGLIAAEFIDQVNDRQLVVVSPPGVGTVPLIVNSPTGSAVTQFTYINPLVICGIFPDNGPASGGEVVNITGFGMGLVTSVEFIEPPPPAPATTVIPATSFAALDDKTLQVVVPRYTGTLIPPFPVAIRLATSAGEVADVLFTYTDFLLEP